MVLEPSTNSTSMRGFMARAGLCFISFRDGLDVEGVVLAFAGSDHGKAERAREGDELDGRRGLVSCRTGIDDPGASALASEGARL